MLQIRLLGRFEVVRNGDIVLISSRPAQHLLAYLFLYPEKMHRREELAGVLWPESDETNARKYLSQSLWRLRKVIGETYFRVDKISIGLNTDAHFQVDVVNLRTAEGQPIEKLMEALSLYEGPLLPGFYEDWITVEAALLQGLFERQMRRLVDLLLEAARWEDVITWCDRWLAMGDLPVFAYRAMMLARHGLNDRPGIAAVFRRYVKAVRDELELGPSAEMENLYLQLSGENLRDERSLASMPPRSFKRPDNPYRGLYSFREEDAPLFFGREEATQRVVEATSHQAFTALIGPSGSGKSSLIYAGLLPHLTNGGGWLPVIFRPGSRPFSSLAGAVIPIISTADRTAERSGEVQQLTEELRSGTTPFHSRLEQVLSAVPDKRRLIVVIDQFEELFTLVQDSCEQNHFLDRLIELAHFQQFRPSPLISTFIALRSDFFGRALAYRPLADLLQDANIILGPMSRQELTRAISLPAQQKSVEFEPGLVRRILDDVAEEPGHLPLLEFAMTSLWAELNGPYISHALYDSFGRADGALSRYADKVYERLDQEEQLACRRLFVQMVRPGEGTEDTRRLASRAEIGEDRWALVQKLADSRLLVTGTDAGGNEIVEVVHEALIRGWGRMREWMVEAREFRLWQERMRVSLRQWESGGKDAGDLLRGNSLTVAEKWLSIRCEDMGEAEQQFIRAGLAARAERNAEKARELHERERLRLARERMRTVFNVGLFVALIVTIILSGLLGLQWRQARSEQARAESERDRADQQAEIAFRRLSGQLAARAQNLYEDQLDLALLLGLEAFHVADTFEARGSLLTGLTHNAAYMTRLWAESDPSSLAFFPDGKRLAAGYADGSLLIWDIATAGAVAHLDAHDGAVQVLTFHPESNLLLSGGDDSFLYLWDFSANPVSKTRLEGHRGGILSAAFSPDGRLIASGGKDRQVIFWDVEAARPVGETLDPGDWVETVVFHPAGNVLVTGSCAARSTGFCKEGEIRLWNIETRAPIGVPAHGHKSAVAGIAFSGDGNRMFSGANFDEVILMWDLPANLALFGYRPAEIFGDRPQATGISTLVMAPDEKTLFIGDRDQTITSWDAGRQRQNGEVYLGHRAAVTGIAISPQGDLLASGSEDGSIILWNLSGEQPLAHSLPIIPDRFVREAIDGAFSDRWAAFINRDGEIFLIDLAHAETPGRLIQAHDAPIRLVLISPDNQRILSIGEDGVLKLWDAETGRQLGEMLKGVALTDFFLCGGVIYKIPTTQISPDSRFLASADTAGRITILDLQTGEPISRPFSVGTDDLRSLAFGNDGSYLVAGADNGSISVWNVESRERIFEYSPPNTGEEVLVLVNPDGKKIVAAYHNTLSVRDGVPGSDTFGQPIGEPISRCIGGLGNDFNTYAAFQSDFSLQFWNLDTGMPLGPPTGPGVVGSFQRSARSPDGKWMSTIDAGSRLSIWDLSSGELMHPNIAEGVVFAFFNQKGNWLALSDTNRQISLLEPETGKVIGMPLEGLQIKAASFTGNWNGDMLAFSDDAGLLYFWDVKTGRLIGQPLSGHSNDVFGYFFDKADEFLLTISKDSAYFWDLRLESWLEKACYRANRNFSVTEWREYFGDEPYRKTCPNLP